MGTENPKYDVAISFLSADETTAAAINQKLAEGLNVFFYPRSQEELAGTDGLESMRKPFFEDSRVIVVLYREPWGKTPWTRVEETAIKDGCLQYGWERLLFIALDKTSAFPRWLPQTHVRFNYADFGLEQAVGAIKARVQENGGQPQPMTAMKRAEMFEAEHRFQRDRARMNSDEGMEKIVSKVAELFQEIEKSCEQIKGTRGFLQIKCGSDFKERSSVQTCVITNDLVGLVVTWKQPYSNTLADSNLFIREFSGRLILPSELAQFMYLAKPELLNEAKYSPDLSLAREYGWKQDKKTDFLSSSALAEQCVIQFVNLAERYAQPRNVFA